MELFILFAWILISILIPIVLLLAGVIDYFQNRDLAKTLPRFLIAVVIYLLSAFLGALLVFGMMDAAIHKQPDHQVLGITGKIFFVLLLLAYSLSGWLLWKFITGKINFLYRSANSDTENPLSLFDSK